jgi:predicted GNAT family N-acyltransferase
MEILHAKRDDLDDIMQIYRIAKQFMIDNGNPNQWTSDWPYREVVEEDLEKRILYKVQFNNQIVGVVCLTSENDHGESYGVVHRVASNGTVKGVAKAVLDFAVSKYGHLKAETSVDNKVMQHIFTKYGFATVGTAKYTYPGASGEPITKEYFCYDLIK